MNIIIDDALSAVRDWKSIAKQIGVSNKEQTLMDAAFRIEF